MYKALPLSSGIEFQRCIRVWLLGHGCRSLPVKRPGFPQMAVGGVVCSPALPLFLLVPSTLFGVEESTSCSVCIRSYSTVYCVGIIQPSAQCKHFFQKIISVCVVAGSDSTNSIFHPLRSQ
jgi:hypothetical protein